MLSKENILKLKQIISEIENLVYEFNDKLDGKKIVLVKETTNNQKVLWTLAHREQVIKERHTAEHGSLEGYVVTHEMSV